MRSPEENSERELPIDPQDIWGFPKKNTRDKIPMQELQERNSMLVVHVSESKVQSVLRCEILLHCDSCASTLLWILPGQDVQSLRPR